jgi:hypothetical protein
VFRPVRFVFEELADLADAHASNYAARSLVTRPS